MKLHNVERTHLLKIWCQEFTTQIYKKWQLPNFLLISYGSKLFIHMVEFAFRLNLRGENILMNLQNSIRICACAHCTKLDQYELLLAYFNVIFSIFIVRLLIQGTHSNFGLLPHYFNINFLDYWQWWGRLYSMKPFVQTIYIFYLLENIIYVLHPQYMGTLYFFQILK